jgi:Resolvase, N terminal domain
VEGPASALRRGFFNQYPVVAERRTRQRVLARQGYAYAGWRIDRLARSTFDLFAIVKRIVDAGGQFKSLAEPWADTATSTGRLMIAVLGGLADVERDLIRKRTAEGRSRATARGLPLRRWTGPASSSRKSPLRKSQNFAPEQRDHHPIPYSWPQLPLSDAGRPGAQSSRQSVRDANLLDLESGRYQIGGHQR